MTWKMSFTERWRPCHLRSVQRAATRIHFIPVFGLAHKRMHIVYIITRKIVHFNFEKQNAKEKTATFMHWIHEWTIHNSYMTEWLNESSISEIVIIMRLLIFACQQTAPNPFACENEKWNLIRNCPIIKSWQRMRVVDAAENLHKPIRRFRRTAKQKYALHSALDVDFIPEQNEMREWCRNTRKKLTTTATNGRMRKN